MARKARGGNSYKTQYKAYQQNGMWKKNKIARLERRVLKNPEDIGAVQALERIEKGDYQYSRNRKSRGHICKNDPGKFIQPELPKLPVDQLYEIGVINEKRRDAVKARMGRVRKR
mgnify:CR=1 FL=1